MFTPLCLHNPSFKGMEATLSFLCSSSLFLLLVSCFPTGPFLFQMQRDTWWIDRSAGKRHRRVNESVTLNL
jgi:hypothetical protein